MLAEEPTALPGVIGCVGETRGRKILRVALALDTCIGRFWTPGVLEILTSCSVAVAAGVHVGISAGFRMSGRVRIWRQSLKKELQSGQRA